MGRSWASPQRQVALEKSADQRKTGAALRRAGSTPAANGVVAVWLTRGGTYVRMDQDRHARRGRGDAGDGDGSSGSHLEARKRFSGRLPLDTRRKDHRLCGDPRGAAEGGEPADPRRRRAVSALDRAQREPPRDPARDSELCRRELPGEGLVVHLDGSSGRPDRRGRRLEHVPVRDRELRGRSGRSGPE